MTQNMNSPKWNNRVCLDSLMEWIELSFPEAREVKGPLKIYRSNDWGITAEFQLIYPTSQENVVCKIGFLPIFKPSPEIYTLLQCASPEHTPTLLKWKYHQEQTWMIFSVFKGKLVRELETLESILETTKTLAKIQTKVSDVSKPHRDGSIPYVSEDQIPDLYRSLLNYIQESYGFAWKAEGNSLVEKLQTSLDDIKKLTDFEYLSSFEPKIESWAQELSKQDYPLSLYHIDLHTNNAVLEEGNILIFDWEEAVLSHPFFSLEKLLEDSRKFDDDESSKIIATSGLSYSPSEWKVRNAYLDEVQWNNRSQRRYDYDLARCLAPVVYMFQSTFFLQQSGWMKDAPFLIGYDLLKAIKRWEEMNG